MIVHSGLSQDSFGVLVLGAKLLLRPQALEETEHFRRWHQQEVAKIVQCGEQISRRKTGNLVIARSSLLRGVFEDRHRIYRPISIDLST